MARILIVEDDQSLRDVFTIIVQSGGHTVATLGKGSTFTVKIKKLV